MTRDEFLAQLTRERFGEPVREYRGWPTPRQMDPPPPVSELEAARHRRDLIQALDETTWIHDAAQEALF